MFIFAEKLVSDVCICGLGKSKEHSFCFGCYKSLPRALRRALYRKIGSGYEKAYLDSIEELLKSGRISYSAPQFAMFLGYLFGQVQRHREEVIITCEETCWCWDADIFSNNHLEAFNDNQANARNQNTDTGEVDRR